MYQMEKKNMDKGFSICVQKGYKTEKKVEYKNNMHAKRLQKYCACKKVTNLGKCIQ